MGRDRVTLQVSATWEEILVAATAAGRGSAPLDERVRRHGEYLLSRLGVAADGQPLAGAVTVTPATEAPPPFTYTLSYPFFPSSSASSPSSPSSPSPPPAASPSATTSSAKSASPWAAPGR